MSKRTEKNNEIVTEFLPPIGGKFGLGPFVYEVVHHNPGKRRFSAKLIGKVSPKEESRLVNLDGKPLK
jgi:hypothetical protein